MDKHELQTIRQEAQRFMKDTQIVLIEKDIVKLTFSFTNSNNSQLYFFVTKPKNSKKFILSIPVESVGLLAVNNTLARLQPYLQSYGLILTQQSVIIEESAIPLHCRIRNLTQALIGIDGIVRLWKVEFDRSESNAVESEDIKPISYAADNRSSG